MIACLILTIGCAILPAGTPTAAPEILQYAGIVQVVAPRRGLAASGLIWSLDSSRLAVTFADQREHRTVSTSLYQLEIATGEMKLIEEVDHELYVIAWLDDDRIAIYVPSHSSGTITEGTWLLRSDGNGPSEQVLENQVLHWARDGRRIATYVVQRGSQTDTWSILIRDLESGAEKKILELDQSIGILDWSPDGESMLLSLDTESPDGRDIYLLTIATGELKRLTRAGFNGDASWSPDGDLIAFTSQRALTSPFEASLSVMRSNGECMMEIALSNMQDFEGVSWSPDGRWAAFTWDEGVYLLDTVQALGQDQAKYNASCP